MPCAARRHLPRLRFVLPDSDPEARQGRGGHGHHGQLHEGQERLHQDDGQAFGESRVPHPVCGHRGGSAHSQDGLRDLRTPCLPGGYEVQDSQEQVRSDGW